MDVFLQAGRAGGSTCCLSLLKEGTYRCGVSQVGPWKGPEGKSLTFALG